MPQQLPLGVGLRETTTFALFRPGANAEAFAAVQAWVRAAGEPFIYLAGHAGSGKTHLLQAACHAAGDTGMAVAYVPLTDPEHFDVAMLEGLETLARVCIDDVQAIAGRRDWELGLFNLYNRLRDSGGRLLVAAREQPALLGIALPDLVSRLAAGVTFTLQSLDDDDKLAALQARAAGRGFDLPDEVGRYLLTRLPRDMHALFAVLDRLDAASLAAQRRLTVPFIKTVME